MMFKTALGSSPGRAVLVYWMKKLNWFVACTSFCGRLRVSVEVSPLQHMLANLLCGVPFDDGLSVHTAMVYTDKIGTPSRTNGRNSRLSNGCHQWHETVWTVGMKHNTLLRLKKKPERSIKAGDTCWHSFYRIKVRRSLWTKVNVQLEGDTQSALGWKIWKAHFVRVALRRKPQSLLWYMSNYDSAFHRSCSDFFQPLNPPGQQNLGHDPHE